MAISASGRSSLADRIEFQFEENDSWYHDGWDDFTIIRIFMMLDKPRGDLQAEYEGWLKENVPEGLWERASPNMPPHGVCGTLHYAFRYPKDAIAFKLRFE